jgi:hypothetical protein
MIIIPPLLAAGLPPVAALATNKLQSTFATAGAVIAFAPGALERPRRAQSSRGPRMRRAMRSVQQASKLAKDVSGCERLLQDFAA